MKGVPLWQPLDQSGGGSSRWEGLGIGSISRRAPKPECHFGRVLPGLMVCPALSSPFLSAPVGHFVAE